METPSGYSKRQIGFISGIPSIRMEEEEASPETRRRAEFGQGVATASTIADTQEYFSQLMRERERILDAMAAKELSTKEKFRLLEENRRYMIFLRGGSSYTFGTEKVIYVMLAFSALIIVILAWLTVSRNLNTEVTTTFVGTVMGGMIATIAQKLGRVGR